MSHFVLQENTDGSVNLTRKQRVLAEICGKVTYVNNKNRTLFAIHAEKMNKDFRCHLSYENPFLPIKEGDAVFGVAEYTVDSRYGDTLNLIQPPLVFLGDDKTTIIKSFTQALHGTGFGTMKANSLLEALILKTGSLSSSIDALDKMATFYCYKGETDTGILQPYTPILKEKQMLELLQWWYKNRNLRRLYLLGINNKELRSSKLDPEQMYKTCLDNPFKIFSLGIDKCDEINHRMGKEVPPEIKVCAEISRKLNECMESKGWSGTPSNILLKMFPDAGKYIDQLREVFGVKTDLHTVYLPYAHEVETGITEFVKNLLDSPILPGTISPSEIVYTRDDLSNEQKIIIAKALYDNICIVRGVAGSGKCLDPHTPILMFDGSIKQMMDTRIGEQVMGPDSKPRTILSRCSGLGQMYRIVPSKGRPFICNGPHILTLKGITPHQVHKNEKRSRFGVKFSVKGISKCKYFITEEEAIKYKNSLPEDVFDISLDEYLKRKSGIQRYNYLFHTGVTFPEKEVPFDPYVMGMWLGDGSSFNARIVNADKEIIDKLNDLLAKYDLKLKLQKSENNNITYNIVGKEDNYWIKGNNSFAKVLREYNLLDNKHVPDIYKINSREVRMQILAGLLDSDGYNAGNYYEITQKNKTLANDIEYLAFSLGFMVTKKEVSKGCMYKGEMRYGLYQRINIMGEGIHEIPVVLERKKCYPRKAKNRANCLRFEVEPIGLCLYHGFELDGDGRFLLGDFTVTHNSTIIKELVHNLKTKGIKYKAVSFTGKAVARIREVTGQKEPMTMHMAIALGDKKTVNHVIIDEASMVTSDLLYEFINKYGNNFRLTLVGDPNQLMPIGWGMLFDQLIKSKIIPAYTLHTCHRTGHNGILTNATNIVECNVPDYNGPPFRFEDSDEFNILEGNTDTIGELVKILQDSGINSNKITVITPFNKYIDEINTICQQIYNSDKRLAKDGNGKIWRINDRVMMTENNYKINVMNGDEGIITDLTQSEIKVTFKDGTDHIFSLSVDTSEALGSIEEGEKVNYGKALTTSSLILSFCVSVHRYQGSECDFIIFFIPEAKESKFLNRNLMYTGITRAKKIIWMVGDYNTMLRAATTAPAYRCDNLSQRLINTRTITMN